MPKLEKFGTKDGHDLVRATLTGTNSQVSILSLGAITQNWQHSVGSSVLPIVLGYENPLDYMNCNNFFGTIVGRVANRISNGRFTLAAREYKLPINEAPHHLHGGSEGLHTWNFKLETDADANAIILSYTSPDGHMGYPATVEFIIKIRLIGDRLTYHLTAKPDRLTPINLAQHSYYNLTGGASCRDHVLWVDSLAHTVNNSANIPTGEVLPSELTQFDFLNPRSLRQADPKNAGFDVNTILRPDRDVLRPCATIKAGLRQLEITTDQPGLQIYDATHLEPTSGGHLGKPYHRFAGLALEPQAYPNALNIPDFGSIICSPDQPYNQVSSMKVTAI